jgi:transcriptional regulator with XRE-family HTH domain
MSSRQLPAALGAAIRDRRGTLGLSQDRLAELVGLHRTYIGAVERGERNVTILNVSKIASGLGLPVSRLLALAEEHLQSGRRPAK